jgi:PEGA domain-containing protein
VIPTRKLALAMTAAMLLVPSSGGISYAFYDDESSLRLQITPRETEVFVDGYFAGTVDNFDGRFQRLHIQPGEHELTLYLEGHRKVTQQIIVRPHASFRIRYAMTPLAAGETPDPRPAPVARPPAAPESKPADHEASPGDAVYGSVAIRVQPADAEVLIDGERWEGRTGNEPLVVQLAAGSHRIEVQKDGYRTYTTQVDVRGGEASPLNVSLSRGEGR